MTADSGTYYRSDEGDTVDLIVWRHYGRQDDRLVEQVLDANPRLAGRGAVLPIGTRVWLPVLPEPSTREGVRLWS